MRAQESSRAARQGEWTSRLPPPQLKHLPKSASLATAVLFVPRALEEPRREEGVDDAEDRDDCSDLRPAARTEQVRVHDRDAEEEDRQSAEAHQRVDQQPLSKEFVVIIHPRAPG